MVVIYSEYELLIQSYIPGNSWIKYTLFGRDTVPFYHHKNNKASLDFFFFLLPFFFLDFPFFPEEAYQAFLLILVIFTTSCRGPIITTK